MGLLSIPEVKILDQKVAIDLTQDERGGYAKFGCTGSYRVQMHKEQTNFLLHIYDVLIASRLIQKVSSTASNKTLRSMIINSFSLNNQKIDGNFVAMTAENRKILSSPSRNFYKN
jgi:hypothetical protein